MSGIWFWVAYFSPTDPHLGAAIIGPCASTEELEERGQKLAPEGSVGAISKSMGNVIEQWPEAMRNRYLTPAELYATGRIVPVDATLTRRTRKHDA